MLFRASAWMVALVLACPVWAETLAGRVVAVADGDTVTVVDRNHARHTVRLAGIDAPERNQPFGAQSRDHLVGLALDKDTVVEFHKEDRYGRLVGKVLIAGNDVNLAQVRAGLAWHYKDYQSEQSLVDRTRYAAEEFMARAAGRGLWSDGSAIPPWDWRRSRSHSLVPAD